MNPLLILGGLAAVGFVAYEAFGKGSNVANAQAAAAAANATYGPAATQQGISLGMSSTQMSDAQSLGLSPSEYMSTLAANGMDPTATLTPQASASGFYDPLSARWYGVAGGYYDPSRVEWYGAAG